MLKNPTVVSVSQLNRYVKSLFESDHILSGLMVRGEISNFTRHYKSGHLYFTLKDDSAAIKAVMFRNYAAHVPFSPENGMSVIVSGSVSLYERDGSYQFYVTDMQPDGIGALHLAYEQLKAKLSAEGLFDEARKRPLPPYPERIGIVTSEGAAALQDMLNILSRRYPLAKVVLCPAQVQGAGAAKTLISGIRALNAAGACDLIIVGRGGGSIEDLWAFNDEALARAIAASDVPVISAVGMRPTSRSPTLRPTCARRPPPPRRSSPCPIWPTCNITSRTSARAATGRLSGASRGWSFGCISFARGLRPPRGFCAPANCGWTRWNGKSARTSGRSWTAREAACNTSARSWRSAAR